MTCKSALKCFSLQLIFSTGIDGSPLVVKTLVTVRAEELNGPT